MSAFTRTAFRSVQVARFSTSAPVRKSIGEAVKDGAKKVDRTISDAAVSGINAGSKVAEKVQEATGTSASEAKGKLHEAAGKAKGAASEVEGKAKGAAEEVKGKMS